MKQQNTILMPESANYLSDFMTELPTGIFNKKVTNTGATTLVLENLQDIILVSPTNNLIYNKLRQYPNKRCSYELFAVNAGVTTTDILKYINRCKGVQPVKLVSTPDSLYKITGITNVYESYHLVIDEFHQLLGMVNNREQAALTVLSEFTKFTKYTFLSATPIHEDFLPYPLNEIPYFDLELTNFEHIKAIPKQTDKPFNAVVDIIKSFKIKGEVLINNKQSKHLYFFINSVTNICNIIKSSGLEAKDVNIICGNTPANERKLLSVGCEIGEFITEDELNVNPLNESPIHFITSTAFNGSDIYSNDGVSIFVTNCHIKSTISGMEILQQISGRIRTKTNPFNGYIFHIYNINKSALSFDEYLKEQQILIDGSLDVVNSWSSQLKGVKKELIDKLSIDDICDYTVYHYYDEKTDTMLLNDLRIKADQYTHKLENLIYTKGYEVRKAYQQQGLDYYKNDWSIAESSLTNVIAKQDFKSYCIAYNESKTAPYYLGEPLFGCCEKTQKLIVMAFDKLGFKKIQELKYHHTNIKEHLFTALSFNTYSVITSINKFFNVGERYTKADIKESIQTIFDNLNIKKKATATTINNYFETKEVMMENRNKGILLIRKLNTIK